MIYITGDTHNNSSIKKINQRHFPLQKKLTKSDYLLICGDFGALWSGDESDQYLLEYYESRNYTTLFIDGNHENFDLINEYPVERW